MGPVIRLAFAEHHVPTFTSWRGTLWIKRGYRTPVPNLGGNMSVQIKQPFIRKEWNVGQFHHHELTAKTIYSTGTAFSERSNNIGKFILFFFMSDSWLVSGKYCRPTVSACRWVMQFCQEPASDRRGELLSSYVVYKSLWIKYDGKREGSGRDLL
jgi:hypothetical protein